MSVFADAQNEKEGSTIGPKRSPTDFPEQLRQRIAHILLVLLDEHTQVLGDLLERAVLVPSLDLVNSLDLAVADIARLDFDRRDRCRNSIASHAIPTAPGGGTVTFVSPWSHSYSTRLEAREESGTPNVVGDIRAALVMLVKEALGSQTILARDAALRHRALAAWSNVPEIRLLGRVDAPALPIFSFQILQPDGEPLHHQLFTMMLSDVHGVQARGGCACAGPYAHRLLGIDRASSDALFRRLGDGHEAEKPGWIRVNFSYLLSDLQADRIIEAVIDLAKRAPDLSRFYRCDLATARFHALSPMMNAG